MTHTTASGKQAVAVPLTNAQKEGIQDAIQNEISSQHGNGNMLSSQDGCEEWEIILNLDGLLPKIDAYLVRYSYSNENGTEGPHRVWGLIELK
jgi:hypothetical protein